MGVVAKRLGLHRVTVYEKRRELGIPAKLPMSRGHTRPSDEECLRTPRKELARACGVSIHAVNTWRAMARKRLAASGKRVPGPARGR